MNPLFKPFCAQISCIKFLSDVTDVNPYFLVGSSMETNNFLSMMRYNQSEDECDQPRQISKVLHNGDVMDIQYNPHYDRILSSSSNGSLNIYNVDECNGNIHLRLDVGWDSVCSASITGTLFNDERIIAVSEDTSIIGIRLDADVIDRSKIFDFQRKDCCSVTAIEKVDVNTFVTSNILGQLKLWDCRSSSLRPEIVGSRSGELLPIHSLASHPGQPNTIVSGSVGCVFLWDLRCSSDKLNAPVQFNTGLSGSDIWKIRFHPTKPQHLFFVASNAGLWSISGRRIGFDWSDQYSSGLSDVQMTSFFNTGFVTMACLDLTESLVAVGTDKEMLCLMPLQEL